MASTFQNCLTMGKYNNFNLYDVRYFKTDSDEFNVRFFIIFNKFIFHFIIVALYYVKQLKSELIENAFNNKFKESYQGYKNMTILCQKTKRK